MAKTKVPPRSAAVELAELLDYPEIAVRFSGQPLRVRPQIDLIILAKLTRALGLAPPSPEPFRSRRSPTSVSFTAPTEGEPRRLALLGRGREPRRSEPARPLGPTRA